MVERRHWFSDLVPHLILVLGVLRRSPSRSSSPSSAPPGTPARSPTARCRLSRAATGLENYYRALFAGRRAAPASRSGMMMLNSFIMAITIAVGKIAISIISAYAVVYFRFPFRMAAFWLIFMTLMLPVEVRIYPTYKIVADLGLLDTYAGLAVPLIASATATLLFRQFFMTIPDELVEASKIDGAGPFQFFMDTVLPLSITTIAALFVIQFIYGWNQYLWPLLITTKPDMQTIVIGIKKMIVTQDALTEWQLAMATAVLAMLPPVARRPADAEAVRARPRRDGEVGDGRCDAGRRPQGLCGQCRGREGREPRHPRRRLLRAGRPVGLRQVHAAAHGRGAGDDHVGRRSPSAAAWSTRSSPPTATSRWCSRTTRSTRTCRVYDNIAYGLRNRGTPKDEIDRRVQEAARILAIEPLPRAPQPRAALRRPAPARRHGPRHRAQAAGVPVRRAAVQPRRQAARADARRDQEAAARARRDLDLRHPRPGRGDDALRQAGRDERRPRRAGRHADARSIAARRRASSRPSSARRP